MKVTKTYCDICNSEESVKTESLQVVFMTEQDEGRSCDPYLSTEKVDICVKCYGEILSGKSIKAQGAQGYNCYGFF